MARHYEKKPVPCSKDPYEKMLGSALNSYTCARSACYDFAFAIQIQAINPDWFANPSVTKKAAILARAKNGEPRPNRRSQDLQEKQLGFALMSYTAESNSSYDRDFTTELKRLRPDWFIKKMAATTKQLLLNMAQQGGRRPRQNSNDKQEARLAHALSCYTRPNHRRYDVAFTEKIKTLAPAWLTVLRVKGKKTLLLDMAKAGKTKPSAASKNDTEKKLGEALRSYTTKGQPSYDSAFSEQIYQLRPDWFHKRGKKKAIAVSGRFYYKLDLETMSLTYIRFDNIQVGDHVMYVDRPSLDDAGSIASTGVFRVSETHIDKKLSHLSYIRSEDNIRLIFSPIEKQDAQRD